MAPGALLHRSSACPGGEFLGGRRRPTRRQFAPLGRGRRVGSILGQSFRLSDPDSPPCMAQSTGGVRLGRELLAYRPSKLGIDLGLGLAISIGTAVFAAISAVIMSEISPEVGESLLRHANDSLRIPVPAWFIAWTVLVTPLGAALVEELAYRGYALPRMTAARLTPGLALWLTSLGFGLQHVAFPFIDSGISFYRCLEIFTIGLALGWIYLKLGRLLPLVVGHYLWDAVPAAFAVGVLVSIGR